MAVELLIGSRDGEHLLIEVLRREHPGADDYWDGNWVVSRISLVVRGFEANIEASLRMDEIHRFNEGLKFIDQNLFGVAVLESMEHWIELRIKCDATGHLSISGWLSDQPGTGNVLSFELAQRDQTYLPRWVRSLSDMEAEFPLLGSR